MTDFPEFSKRWCATGVTDMPWFAIIETFAAKCVELRWSFGGFRVTPVNNDTLPATYGSISAVAIG
jgi:hypothetical protein